MKGLLMSGSFSDSPTHDDKFSIENYINGLSNFIIECETPLTIAIQGDWGTGKTSIMYQVEKRLNPEKQDKKIQTIFFNTWQYSQFDMGNNLAVALITDLISELNVEDSKKKQFFKKAKGALSKGLEYVNLDFGILNGEKLTEKFQDLIIGFGERTDDIKHLKENLQDIINDAIKENKSDRIVIFIDDLDRLVPEKAIELLEVLKLFLDCEHCVFVLAIDYNVVVKGAKSKYGKDLDDEKGKAFFEKIIQVPFTVPVANYDLQNFIRNSLEKLDFKFNEKNGDKSIIETVTQLIRYTIGNNPRTINRLFNSVSLLTYINGNVDISDVEKLMILTMVCFQLRFEEAYDYLLTVYNNTPEDDDQDGIVESYLINLLENSFEEIENPLYEKLILLHGKYSLKNVKDKDDFTNFYISLKKLLGYNEQKLTLDHFNKLIEQMTFSNAVSIGNTDTITAEKKKQTHVPNRNVQLIIRKLFNKLAGVKNHFDITNPELFGTESNEQRNMPLDKQHIKEENILDRIRLTGSKGQGIYIFSSSDPSNSIYLSGDTHGRLFNDGLQLIIDGKQIKKIKINYLADELVENDNMYKEFEEIFFKHYYKLVDIAKEYLRE
jgi:hypothetical protein